MIGRLRPVSELLSDPPSPCKRSFEKAANNHLWVSKGLLHSFVKPSQSSSPLLLDHQSLISWHRQSIRNDIWHDNFHSSPILLKLIPEIGFTFLLTANRMNQARRPMAGMTAIIPITYTVVPVMSSITLKTSVRGRWQCQYIQ